MAPEQAQTKSYGKKIDIWAAGLVIYQLLTGKHPLFKKGVDTDSTFQKKLRETKDLELPEDLEVSPLMRDLFRKLCKINPTERYEARMILQHPVLTGNADDPIPLTASEKLL
jgi:serine/threonine protein kinase